MPVRASRTPPPARAAPPCRPENPNHYRLARAGEHFLHAFSEIGLDIAIDAGIAGDRVLYSFQGLVVVDLRIDADPVLREVDAHDLVGHKRPADVSAEVAHPGNGSQFFAGSYRHPVHLGMRCPGRRHPVHEEVALLEGRQQRGSEQRPNGQPRDHDQCGARKDRARSRDDPRQHGGIAALQPPDQRRDALDRRSLKKDKAECRRHRQRHGHRSEERDGIGKSPAARRRCPTGRP